VGPAGIDYGKFPSQGSADLEAHIGT